MLNTQTLNTLRSLKLTGMAQALEQQQAQPATHDELGFEERLALLVDREALYRNNNKITRLLKAARLKLQACPEDIDYRHPRGLNKSQFADLLSSHWIHQHHNVLITGPTGCGKTYLGCVLATQACRHGLSVRYFRTSRLLEALSIAHGDGRFSKLIQQLAKTDLLLLDDWGLEKMTLGQRNDLLEIMEDRHGLRSTLITSQLPLKQWHHTIGDATLADAILDRLLHNSHKINLKGESMRKAMSDIVHSDHS
ncbi:MAG: IS21-like element helper ATPase IstB [Gammaproteobacteria bacterium]